MKAMRGSKKRKLRIEKQLRETRLRMDVLDNNSKRVGETNVSLDNFAKREEETDPDADNQKMEQFEIETENEEYTGYIYKVKNPLQRLLSLIKRNQKITVTLFSLLLICIIVVPIVVTLAPHKENKKTTTTTEISTRSSTTASSSTTSLSTTTLKVGIT